MDNKYIDEIFNSINWRKTIGMSIAAGSLNILAGIAYSIGGYAASIGKRATSSLKYVANIGKYVNQDTVIAARLLAGCVATLSEISFDFNVLN